MEKDKIFKQSEELESEITILNKLLIEKDKVIKQQITQADGVYNELTTLNSSLIEKDELINQQLIDNNNIKRELVNLRERIKGRNSQIAQFERSLSWRITKPFRNLNGIFKK